VKQVFAVLSVGCFIGMSYFWYGLGWEPFLTSFAWGFGVNFFAHMAKVTK
jgi:hypothetical protein